MAVSGLVLAGGVVADDVNVTIDNFQSDFATHSLWYEDCSFESRL